jgi:hypothetical protein
MEEPYMDPISGLVLDLSTWEEMITGRISPAVEWWAQSTEELIRMNYEVHRLDIVNH